MKSAVILVLTLLLVPWVSTYAQAGPRPSTACSSHKNVVSILWKRWAEKSVSVGVTSNGRLLEVFVNRSTGSWSVVLTWSRTHSCIIESGWNWRDPILVDETET